MQGTKLMHDALLEAGWAKTMATETGAYERAAVSYLTWRKGGVLVATSATLKEADPVRGAVHSHMGSGAEVTVEALVTEGGRRQGRASQALAEWASLADSCGVTLYLEPVSLEDGGISEDALIALYQRAGFKAADRWVRVMVRAPMGLAKGATKVD